MTVMFFILTLILGILAALAGGALSGMHIGKEALGAELAAYIGGLYGLISGVVAVLVGLIVVAII